MTTADVEATMLAKYTAQVGSIPCLTEGSIPSLYSYWCARINGHAAACVSGTSMYNKSPKKNESLYRQSVFAELFQ